MSINYKNVNNLKVSENLLNFVNNELLKETNIDPKKFWSKFDEIVHELEPKNKTLLKIREQLQKKIDEWHKSKKDKEFNKSEYINFLKS